MTLPAHIAVRFAAEPLRQKLLAEGLPPLAARVLAARDISGRGDVAPKLSELPPPDFLPDIDKFCDAAAAAVLAGKKICVAGDYDADGMCATALAVECLRAMNADVFWQIPDRIRHGYGLHSEIVEAAAAAGAEFLLTVDNGVSANAAVARAKELGMTVCITDHHLPPPELPAADCIVNPMLQENPAGKNLAGVGVAFYAMAALRRRLSAKVKMNKFLDLVALGTVADCMPMDKLNRTLVGGGLSRLRAALRPGVAALAADAGRDTKTANCRDISHFFAPRINAAGRFGQTELAMECLLAKNSAAAANAAAAMARLNQKRKDMVAKILRQIGEEPKPPPVLFNKNWQLGVLGIVAGHAAEMRNGPALVFGMCNGAWRGSGRAPPGWDLHQIAAAAAKSCGEEGIRFGGHRRAVGVSVRDVESFAAAFAEACRAAAPQTAPRLDVDEMPPPEEITSAGVGMLDDIVWGEEFPRPLFAGDFAVAGVRKMGAGHARFRLEGEGWALPAVAFNREPADGMARPVFSLSVDKYTKAPSAVVETFL